MTSEEAIEALEILRILDAPGLSEAVHMAIDALRAQQEANNNESILEMDGQPVWVEHPDEYKHYNGWTLVVVSWKVLKQVRVTYATGRSSDVSLLLDDGAKIYRRPPEKEEPNG